MAVLIAKKAAAVAAAPASIIFNGTDEYLARTLSTSAPGTTIFTYSLWVKIAAYDASDAARLFQVINAPTNSEYMAGDINTLGDEIDLQQSSGAAAWSRFAAPITPDIATGAWRHIVFRYDSTDGTAGNRARVYLDGTLITGSGTNPALNEAHRLFTDGREHQIGAWADVSDFLNGRLAFIDVIDGISLAPTDFAFDDGGTWTRIPYAGSYGTYGFSLDGTDGFNDVSGNAQHFTGTNMTAGANLDGADLPPYTS